MFWVSGKAGSGKSTLIKFLYDNPRTISELKQWSKDTDLVTAGFFFWNSGTEMQKSVEGLLQSLLHEVLRKYPALMPLVVPSRWEECVDYHAKQMPWTEKELREVINRISNCQDQSASVKFCFFIDGLDEYDGNHAELINILRRLVSTTQIKLCVSSRPWNVFQEALGHEYEQKISLEDLTKPDIDLYVRETLQGSAHFLSLREIDTRYEGLVFEITKKADGVFLWVFLIVRSILQGLLNCDRISELEHRVKLLPSKLEEYFLHMLVTTDEAYHERAAETFQLALHAAQPLSLMTFSFLDEVDESNAIQAPIKPLARRDILHRLRTMKRRLSARCNGLLEATNPFVCKRRILLNNAIDDFWDVTPRAEDERIEFFFTFRVGFLHRTVRDFLQLKDTQSMLQARLPDGFRPTTAIAQALLAQIKTFPVTSSRKSYFQFILGDLCETLMLHLRESESRYLTPEITVLDELERTLFTLSFTLPNLQLGINIPYCVRLVIYYGLSGYIYHRFKYRRSSLPPIEVLLDYSVNPIEVLLNYYVDGNRSDELIRGPVMLHIPTLKILLDLSKMERDHGWTCCELPLIWRKFLGSLPEEWQHLPFQNQHDRVQVIQMLLEIGADPNEKLHGGLLLWHEVVEKLTNLTTSRPETSLLIDEISNTFLSFGGIARPTTVLSVKETSSSA